jgi:hypothetical protein
MGLLHFGVVLYQLLTDYPSVFRLYLRNPVKSFSMPVASVCTSVDPNKHIVRYGQKWPKPNFDDLNIELYCLQNFERFTIENGGLGRAGHFRNVVSMLWHKGTVKPFVWHPWAERMLEAACANKYLAVAGCGSSGKTEFFAVWAIVNFLCAPKDTMVLVTSTSLKEARKRIWGAIRDYWQAIPGLPGKLVDSIGQIRLDDGSGENKFSDRCGISLVAGEKKKEREAIGKLIGMKNARVFLIADELPELSEAIIEAAVSNLSLNPYFQLIGIGNPASYYDAFGVFAKPKAGWQSITPNDEEWETEKGWCIRFDGEKSPNILAGRKLYPWMITQDTIDEAQQKMGANSLSYWRMYRGFWCPSGEEQSIYSEADIIKYKADIPALWKEPPTRIAALDPAFTNGGDRCALYYGFVGTNEEGMKTIMFDSYELLREDVTLKDEPRTNQIVRQFREKCEAQGIVPKHAAFDASGAGGPFGDVVATLWSNEVLRVQFGGSASDLPVSLSDRTPSKARYTNRVTELWFSGRELMRTGQLKGVSPDLAREMCARRYETRKDVSLRMVAESKQDMKMRTGKSPDIADAAFILVDLCRQRFGFWSKNPESLKSGSSNDKWFQRMRMVNSGRTLTR